MKLSKTLAIVVGFGVLAACGGGGQDEAANADANAMMTDNLGMPADNMSMDMNTDLNADMNMDMNTGMTNDMNTTVNTTTNTDATGNTTD